MSVKVQTAPEPYLRTRSVVRAADSCPLYPITPAVPAFAEDARRSKAEVLCLFLDNGIQPDTSFRVVPRDPDQDWGAENARLQKQSVSSHESPAEVHRRCGCGHVHVVMNYPTSILTSPAPDPGLCYSKPLSSLSHLPPSHQQHSSSSAVPQNLPHSAPIAT
eukprot:CAMPEP_0173469782 /NCGR_PEP_ID=MMETSP1357-20121228/77540_1 /TAXON_ID=77926 /ORGANISM="Hemiselmis rufescens, Strain PCC563" /LENGTH=161 /DNA_ID=CAMNT_0014438033 /DNA_START=1111 /DNA_END=1594 /DNA_ORIENTATION=+